MEYSNRNTRSKQGRSAPDLKVIGSRIRSLRADVLQEDFASQLGISQAQLSKLEHGKVAPSLDVLVMLSGQFKKSLDWIVTGKK
jgi:transcriptional regulator with XRE-family HTH domain